MWLFHLILLVIIILHFSAFHITHVNIISNATLLKQNKIILNVTSYLLKKEFSSKQLQFLKQRAGLKATQLGFIPFFIAYMQLTKMHHAKTKLTNLACMYQCLLCLFYAEFP